MGFIQKCFDTGRNPLSIFLCIVIVITAQSSWAAPNAFPEIEQIGLDTDQIVMSLESPEQQQQHITHMGEKRSWQNLQGSWGKRDSPSPNTIDDYDTFHLPLGISDDGIENEDINNPLKYAVLYRPGQDHTFANEQKRGWKAMNGAWGKRLSNGGDWNKFRGSWGKREPGWNNLKGLWGKRSATNWNKLQSAWGKRDLSNVPSTY